MRYKTISCLVGTVVPFTAPDSAVFDWFGVTPGYSHSETLPVVPQRWCRCMCRPLPWEKVGVPVIRWAA